MNLKLFEELTQLHGVSGYESEVCNFIREKLKGHVDDMQTDVHGNLIAFKRGSDANAKKLLFCAHMDEIGLQVLKIEDDGRLLVRQLGACWIYTTYQARVRFANGVIGIVASRVKPEKIDGQLLNLYIDIGVSTKKEALDLVDIGDVCTYVGPFTDMPGNNITAKAVDDRVGCFLQMQALMDIPQPKNDIYMAFTIQEEVGTRGGGIVAHRVRPNLGVAIDVTPAHDRPGDLEGSNALGKGVAIKISDLHSISNKNLVDLAVNLCREKDIPYQKDVLYIGGTDAGAISLTRDGIQTVGFSVVTRYTHGPNAIANKDDIAAALSLIKLFMDASF